MRDLIEIPGIGKILKKDLIFLGFNYVEDLKDADPQKMFDRLCKFKNSRQDPCVLYTFHCAVYYASNKNHDPELLRWWNWKNVFSTSDVG